MQYVKYEKKLFQKKQYDVIVCGGGVSGVAAAVSTAKNGLSTLLIEKSNILGGLATLGLINLFVPMCNGRGKQIIFGLCEKWTRMSAMHGYDTIPDEWQNGEPEEATEKRYMQEYSPYIFALQLMEEVKEAGVDLLYDCIATDPIMESNTVKGVVTESKSGTEYYGCRILIDVTGECDVFRRGGIPTVSGKNYYTYVGKTITLEGCEKAVEKRNIRYAYGQIFGGSINLFGDRQPPEIPLWSGLTVEEVNDYLLKNQTEMLEKIKNSDRLSRDIAMLPLMPQFRTTCRLDGEYALTAYDAYKHFDDSIGAINDFEHRDHLFEVPYRSIMRRDYPNILTAGRSAAGDGYGWDLLRVIPAAIITGQGAGEAACIAVRDGCGTGDVNIKKLQSNLEQANIMVHFPDCYVPEDKTVIIHGEILNYPR